MTKRILISGASRGIGRAIARTLASPEVSFILVGRDLPALEETARLCKEQGAQSSIMVCDLADPVQIDRLLEDLSGEPIYAVIHNAGVAVIKPYQDLTLAEWNNVLAINVTAPFLINKGLFAQLRPGSSIVNILSVAATRGFPTWSSYCMSKFALDGFARAMREELRSCGVRVINIIPSATDTELWNAVPGNWPRDKMLAADEVAATVAFALSREESTLIEEIRVAGIAGNL